MLKSHWDRGWTNPQRRYRHCYDMGFFYPSDTDYGKREGVVEISSSRSYGPDWKKYAEKDIFSKMIDIGWISNEVHFMNDTEGIIALISAS